MDDRYDTQINLPREPTIEAHLLLTCPSPQLRRAEVQKIETDRLLELIGESIRQKHPGDVGFDAFHAAGLVVVGGGLA
jgi:hypothetical protein